MVDYAKARTAMVDCQVRPADVTRYAVIAAMLDVPRERFVPLAQRPLAYAEMQVPLAPGRVLLDARTLAKMFDSLEIADSDLVLTVGAGYGYASVIAARMAASVVALEDNADLAQHLEDNLAALRADTVLVERGPLSEGVPGSAPFDVIIVEGGVERVPQALLDQLAEGGRLAAIRMDGVLGQCRIWRRAGDSFSSRPAFEASAPVLPGFDAERSFTF